MSFSFFLEDMLKSLKCLTIYMAIILVLTIIVTIVISKLSKNLWVDKKKFQWLGLFYGMDKRSCLGLASCWMLLILTILYVLNRKEVNYVEYAFYLCPALVYTWVGRPRKRMPLRLLISVLLFLGVFATDLIVGYMEHTFSTIFLTYIYICLTVIMVLFSVYIFMVELNNISKYRKPFEGMEIQ